MAVRIFLNPSLPTSLPKELRKFARDVAAIIDEPLFHPAVTFDAEGATAANTHRVTIQVRNRRSTALKSQFLVYFFIAATAGGNPQNAQAVGFVAGTIIQTITANQDFLVMTDANGQIVVDITIVGAATRYIRGCVLAEIETSDAIVWT